MSLTIRELFIVLVFCTPFVHALSVLGFESKNEESFLEDVNIKELLSDLCNPNPCQNNGKCFEGTNGHKCFCMMPFFGKNCEMDPCTENQCYNGGTCVMTEYSFKCQCRYPYNGDLCQDDICSRDPCYNGGTCESDGDSYKCKCHFPYSGVNCENDWIETTLDSTDDIKDNTTEHYKWTPNNSSEFPEILNQTTDNYDWTSNNSSDFPKVFNVTSDIYDWTSNDSSEFPGILNQTTDNYDWTSNNSSDFPKVFNVTSDIYDWTSNDSSEFPQVYNETTSFPDDFNATYNPSNFTDDFNISVHEIKNFTDGYNLTTIEPEICIKDFECLNGGICQRRKNGQNFCECLKNFEGDWCETNTLCKKLFFTCNAMRATCKVIGFKAICECPEGKMYNPQSGICENICNPWRCLHGTCEIVERSFICNCDSGYKGYNCNEKITIKPERYNVWFPVTAFLLTLIFIILIGIFCHICRPKQKTRASVLNLAKGHATQSNSYDTSILSRVF